MSLKSFDKFCENIILGEPSSQKAIYDERQNQVRAKLTIEALTIFGAMSILNALIMDLGFQWCESHFAPMCLFMALCYIYWVIRNAKKGTLFGVNGTKQAEFTASIMIGQGFIYSLLYLSDVPEEINFFINDGMVSERLLMVLFFVLDLAVGIIVLVLAHRYKKRAEAEEN